MTKALRVLILGLNYAPEPTGIAPYTTGMAHFLADAGHDVHVVTGLPALPAVGARPRLPRPPHPRTTGSVRITRVSHPVPVPTGNEPDRDGGRLRAQAAAVGGRTPDVVLAVSPALLTVGAALRLRRPGRTAVGVVVQDLYSRAIVETGAPHRPRGGGRGAPRAVRCCGAPTEWSPSTRASAAR